MDQNQNGHNSENQIVNRVENSIGGVAEPMTQAARFENATQQLTQDLSLKQISQILIQNWALFVILFVVFAGLSTLIYAFKVPFVSNVSIIINDAQNSSLQSMVQGLGNAPSKVNEAKKANSGVQKYLEYLKTTEFFQELLTQAELATQNEGLSLAEKSGSEIFKKEILLNKKTTEMSAEEKLIAFKKLDAALNFKISSDFELELNSSAQTKELALFLANVSLDVVAKELKQRELLELDKMQTFLKAQKDSIDLELQSLNKKLADFQSQPENLISLSSKDKVGEYISELMMRKNETQLKISENNKVIAMLSANSNGRRESQLYGNGGRVRSIQIENEMLRAKIGQIQSAIDRVTQQAKTMPVAGQVYEEMKKKSDIEFERYKEVTEALAKSNVYQLSLANKFEVLEKARFEKVKPLVSLLTLLLVSLVVSQILGSLIIYVTTIWDSSLVTAQSTRNVVVIDSHSLDPRVVIENSKLKFRLRNSEFDSPDSNEPFSEQRLGFNFRKAEGDGPLSEEG